jgi:glycosyltransferase involved in cell wall biosynthesis
MARIGINPARGKISDYHPAKVSLAVITYIPDLSGYFEHRLEVLQLVLSSLHAHTPQPYDLLVFDNGSCSTVVDYLRQSQSDGQINYLILSRQNIGKIGALRILFEAAPGEIIAYNDDDILFYPGWLEAHLEILEHFPQAGMVSGTPVRNAARHARKSLEQIADQNVPGLSVAFERRIPDEWEIDWALSTGRDPQAYLQETQGQLDMVLHVERSGAQGFYEAIGSANHFQFISRKGVLLQALPSEWSGKLMGHMLELDEAVDNLGYLRLSTTQRYTRHLGNALSEQVIQEAQALGLLSADNGRIKNIRRQTGGTSSADRGSGKNSKRYFVPPRHWLLRIPGSRRILLAAYKRLFDILYR